ncbi:MAG: hypothetical protein ABI769_11095 [Pseudomonadota bacterium]
MSSHRSIGIASVLLLVFVISGCGGGGNGGGSSSSGSGGGAQSLTLSPASASIAANTTVALVAAGGTSPYAYAVSAGSGSVTATGVYTAPPTAGSATVTVTDAAGTRATATVTTTVTIAVSIFPGSITIPASSGQSYTFAGQNGSVPYQFALVSGPGSITSNGVYTAGTRSGTATIQVTDQAGITATATVKSVFVRTNGPVFSAVTDGISWYIGGSFSAVNAYQTPHFAALDLANGSPNLACDLQDGFDDTVLTTVSDGTALYVGGNFSHYRGVDTPGGLVKIDPVTCQIIRTFFLSTDQATSTSALFVSGTSLLVNAYARRYRGGAVSTSVGHTLIRLDTVTGNLDPAFRVTLPIGELQRIFATPSAVYAGIFKLDSVTGVWDTNFQLPFNSTPFSYAAVGNSLYVGALFSDGSSALRKLDANTGALDPVFNQTLFTGYVYDLAVAGNSLYVAGTFSPSGAQTSLGLAKVDATTGAVDPAFAPTGPFVRPVADGGVHSIVYDNGSLYAAGNFLIQGNSPAMRIAKLNGATGAIDTTFTKSVGLSDTGFSLIKQGNTLFVGGKFVGYRGTAAANLAKLSVADGVADQAFTNNGTDGRVSALALNNGSLFLAGEFHHYNGVETEYLAKINASSAALDTAFSQGGGTNEPIMNLAVSDSGLFISGAFILYRGELQFGFAKLRYTDGAVDPTFVNGFTDGSAGPVAVRGQYVYTASSSSHYGTLVYPTINRINVLTGAADVNFPGVPSAGAFHVAISFLGDTGYASLLRFPNSGGNPSSTIVKFDGTTGAMDLNFVASFDQVFDPIYALRGIGSSLYVAATPTQNANDSYGYFLAKLNAATGVMDTTFSPPSAAANGSIRVLETTGTDLWAGGEFSRYRGAAANFFVRIDPVTGAISEP